ncbi:MAG: flippase [Gammaproteobacteria bacterium]|nr:MAG: flippase [Gammaproteobacteria bacterium]
MNAAWLKYLPGFLRNRLEGRHSMQQAVGNSGWLLLDKVVRSGVAFVIIIWLARYLGPQQFGIFNYVLAIVAITNAIAAFGLEDIVIRELVYSPSERNEILGTAFVIKLIGGGIAFITAITAIRWLRPDEAIMLWLVGIAAAGSFFLTLDVIDYWFRSAVQSKYTVIARVTSAMILNLFKAGLIIFKAPLSAFIVAIVVEVALSGVLLVVMYKIRVGRVLAWNATKARAVSLLKYCWPLFFSAIVVMIYMKIDQVMIGEMLGEQEVGIYSAAVRLVEMWYIVPAILASSIFPALYKLKFDNPERYLQRIQQFFDFMVIVSVVAGVLILIVAEQIIILVFGSEYRDAVEVLQIYIWSSVFVFLIIATGSYLLAENKTIFLLFRYTLGMVINVALNWLLIPVYGIEGSAFATLIAYLFAAYLSGCLYKGMWQLFVMETRALYLPGSLMRLYGNK